MDRRRQGSRGFSLLELLIVMVILAIMMAFFIPLAAERMRVARVRTSVANFALDLKAARWAAVSNRAPVDMVISVDPGNAYEFTDTRGRVRRIALPDGIRIVSSTNPIRFLENGSIPGGASTVIEMKVSERTVSRWTLGTNVLGVTQTAHQEVAL